MVATYDFEMHGGVEGMCSLHHPLFTFESSIGAIALPPKNWDTSPTQFRPSSEFHISKSYEKRDETKVQLQRSEESDDGEKLSINLGHHNPILFIDISLLTP
jgi:hypothetical protein